MTTFCFKTKAEEFRIATKTGALPGVKDHPFFIQLHKKKLVTDLHMPFTTNDGRSYELHACAELPVKKYANASGMHCNQARMIKVVGRDKFNESHTRLVDLKKRDELELQVFNNNTQQLFESARFILRTSTSEGSMESFEVEEVDGIIPVPDYYDTNNEEAEVMYNSKHPEKILFFSNRVPEYWIATELHEPGSIEELNNLRGSLERDRAPTIEGDSYVMPKARRGRKQATAPAPPAITEPETETNPETETPEPNCKACGDTGLNSKGGPCVCAAKTTPEPPAPAPEPTPAPTPEPPAPAPAPEATTKPPLTPSEEGTQEEAPGTDAEKPESKKPARRTKEEIRADKLDKAFQLLTDEQEEEDVCDRLEEFCRTILISHGYIVEKAESTGEALTLKERLGVVGNMLENLIGGLTKAKDQVGAAEASTDGLMTKEDLLKKLMD